MPGGFGVRGLEGKLGALRHAREQRIPTLGLCLGLQSMVIEYARNVLGLEDADSTEFDPETASPVIATMAEQEQIVAGEGDLGGTMRLGAFPATLRPGSVVAEAYGTTEVTERHRHRYEVNNAYRDRLEEAGLAICGTSPDGALVEFDGAAPGRAPVLRVHAGPPGVLLPADPPAPAVRRPRRRRPGRRADAAARR